MCGKWWYSFRFDAHTEGDIEGAGLGEKYFSRHFNNVPPVLRHFLVGLFHHLSHPHSCMVKVFDVFQINIEV